MTQKKVQINTKILQENACGIFMAEIMRTYSISDNLDDGSIPRSPFKLEHISIYLIFLFLCLFIQSMFPGLRFRSDIYRIWIRLSRKKKKRKNTDPT